MTSAMETTSNDDVANAAAQNHDPATATSAADPPSSTVSSTSPALPVAANGRSRGARTRQGEAISPQASANHKVCGVCEDRAWANNFGALSCESCKAFFRRNALRPKQQQCVFQNECVIRKTTRRFCPACRLKKCFAIGMMPELILGEEAKKARQTKRQQKCHQKERSQDGDWLTDTLQFPQLQTGDTGTVCAPQTTLPIQPSTSSPTVSSNLVSPPTLSQTSVATPLLSSSPFPQTSPAILFSPPSASQTIATCLVSSQPFSQTSSATPPLLPPLHSQTSIVTPSLLPPPHIQTSFATPLLSPPPVSQTSGATPFLSSPLHSQISSLLLPPNSHTSFANPLLSPPPVSQTSGATPLLSPPPVSQTSGATLLLSSPSVSLSSNVTPLLSSPPVPQTSSVTPLLSPPPVSQTSSATPLLSPPLASLTTIPTSFLSPPLNTETSVATPFLSPPSSSQTSITTRLLSPPSFSQTTTPSPISLPPVSTPTAVPLPSYIDKFLQQALEGSNRSSCGFNIDFPVAVQPRATWPQSSRVSQTPEPPSSSALFHPAYNEPYAAGDSNHGRLRSSSGIRERGEEASPRGSDPPSSGRQRVVFQHVPREELPSDMKQYWLLSKEERFQLTHLTATYQDTMMTLAEKEPGKPVRLTLQDVPLSMDDYMKLLDDVLHLCVRFAKAVPEFQRLQQADQIAVLKASSLPCYGIAASSMFIPEREKWMSQFGQVGREHFPPSLYSQAFLGDALEFSRNLKAIAKNEVSVYALLHCIVLFDPRESSIENRQLVNALRDKYVILLKHHLESQYSYLHADRYFSALTDIVVRIRILGEWGRSFYAQIAEGNFKPLSAEFFSPD